MNHNSADEINRLIDATLAAASSPENTARIQIAPPGCFGIEEPITDNPEDFLKQIRMWNQAVSDVFLPAA